MTTEAPTTPACVYLLADHLDATLAAGEDLIKAGLDWHQEQEDAQTTSTPDPMRQRKALEELRTLELLIIARVLQARDRANEVAEHSPMFRTMARLFVSGTTNLRDIIKSCGDSSVADFETGDGITSYLRTRGLMRQDAASIEEDSNAVSSAEALETNFLVAARLPLHILLDNVATFLDALDIQFELYEVDDDEVEIVHFEENAFDDAVYDSALPGGLKDEASRIEIALEKLSKNTKRETLAERLARLPQA